MRSLTAVAQLAAAVLLALAAAPAHGTNTRLTRSIMKHDDAAGCSDDDDCNLNGVCSAGLGC